MAIRAKRKIQLKKKAAQLMKEAEAEKNELQEFVERQASGELEEGESRLSAEEIQDRVAAIKEKVADAKETQNVASLEGLIESADDANDAAREILSGAETEGSEGYTTRFKDATHFLRAVRAQSGEFDYGRVPDEKQRKELRVLRKAAAEFRNGNPVSEKQLIESEWAEKTLVGDDNTSDGRADHLVPEEHLAELLRAMSESQQFVPLARRVPMARPTITFPRLRQTDADTARPLHSMAQVTKKDQAQQIDEREPVFEQFSFTAVNYKAYLEAADELLADSIVDMPPVIVDLLTSATAYEYDRDCIRGSGNDEPQGYQGSDAEYAQERQAADDIQLEDIFNLESRFFGDDGVYFFHQSIIPKLYALSDSNVIVWNGDVSSDVPGTLLGRRLIRTAKVPALGDKGDLSLVDPTMYLAGDLQRITVATSGDFKFRNAVTAWRSQFRAAGSPWPAGTFAEEASGGSKTWEVASFVTLDSAIAS